LFTVTLDELQGGLATGAFSSVDLVKVPPLHRPLWLPITSWNSLLMLGVSRIGT
jgi:hypothetical protein